jgi:polysaccharide pyruvyl transferase WcaK-like protein
MPATPTAVVMNDTSTRYHHGCARVMRLLVQALEDRGIDIIARSPARHDWKNDADFLDAMRRADLIVINGEGTIHHGKPAGEALLRVATHPARGQTPVALINALYEENPADWGAYLRHFTLLVARDSASAARMAQDSGGPVRWLPDLSLSAPSEVPNAPRHGTIVGDSVRLEKRRVLAQAASRIPDCRFIPTKTLRGKIWRLPLLGGILRGALFRLYNAVWVLRAPRFLMPLTEQGYLSEIAAARLHITGRFHAVCLSMLTETPFLALTSNASKIEQLLRDAGLDTHRIIGADQLSSLPQTTEFTAVELEKIRAFRQKAQADSEHLFNELAAMAQDHQRQNS